MVVVELTPQTRDGFLQGPQRPKFVLLEIYAPWCPHCRGFASEYERLSRELEFSYHGEVVVARYDGAHFPIPQYLDVEYFPSFFLMGRSLERPLTYSGSRSVSGLKAFVADVVALASNRWHHKGPPFHG
eukprot:Gregarina_sp_Poly_1__3627@NODE_2069_length_2739_cov_40_119386_g590_i2_p3_GENE_NODE_2069_length_2739_cov_40_119386_g590_i2NODE_2069_length_2739_cov_40_119386_g590_i2_p3_ORF_typecomplete_len129_score10_17Thioredoxin/PF00085_20/2e14Thioredoxin_8/PF13905_6/0_0017Thioredoxin_8/PF13905_6/2_6e03TraF/PF13728_6/0_0021AhpCTSA/PF00578_21/0_0044Thioredoxin_7/PF13899_6/0_013Thioredoxin_2/PF13098_6/0_033Redoxin/PF08534_10/0_14Thioredoxin_4/PF13462_6/0_43Thioredoxin_4/PF13462_6/9e02Thioredoxin_3/PF13192_6/0_17